jgi:hypothetical protein
MHSVTDARSKPGWDNETRMGARPPRRTRRLAARLSLAFLALAAALVGCAREPAYFSDGRSIPQPTPDKTVDAVIRGLAQPAVAAPAASTSTPAPTLPTTAQSAPGGESPQRNARLPGPPVLAGPLAAGASQPRSAAPTSTPVPATATPAPVRPTARPPTNTPTRSEANAAVPTATTAQPPATPTRPRGTPTPGR